MWKDPVVEEIRGYREEYAARFNFDLKAICRDLRKPTKTHTARRIFATETSSAAG
jgi:hypothetical protein